MSSVGHGGSRKGAGRKRGDGWKSDRPNSIRGTARAKLKVLLAGQRDPLSVLVEIAANEDVEIPLRIHAAGVALPFMLPKLSAAVISSTTEIRVDPGRLLQTINERIAKLAAPRDQAGQTVLDVVAETIAEGI